MASVQFLSQESSQSPDGRLAANYLKCEINGNIFEFPHFNANKSDYDKAGRSATNLTSQSFQYFVNELDPRVHDILHEDRKQKISDNFNEIVTTRTPLLTDITLYYDSHDVGIERRNEFLKLQKELNTTFLSDIEADKHQDLIAFTNQLDSLDAFDSDQIRSPTISMHTSDELFAKKLDKIFERGYDRFNVDWAGAGSNSTRWLILVRELVNKKIICNMTSIIQNRNYYPPFESFVMKQFLLGVHSCGIGYTGGGGSKDTEPKKMLFDEKSWQYNEHPEFTKDLVDTLSHNKISKVVTDSYESIRNDQYFDDVVPDGFSALMP